MVYRLYDGVWELGERNGAGTNSSWRPGRRMESVLDLQARIRVEHPVRIATEAGKTRRLHPSPDS
jgi:hypothetical protein